MESGDADPREPYSLEQYARPADFRAKVMAHKNRPARMQLGNHARCTSRTRSP